MKKDKEWLKKKMIYLKEAVGKPAVNDFSRGLNGAYDTLELLIDQLDEPNVSNETVNDILDANRKLSKRVKELGSELPVVPQFVADHIKYFKEDTLTLGDALDSHYEDNRKMHTWLYENIEARNDEVFARAWLDSYTIEQPKTYRFTLNAFHEIDVTAASFEEAQKNADVMWNQYFARQRDFGEAEFEGEVNEDGDLNG